MFLIVAVLTTIVGLYHSIAGDKNLIRPLVERDDFPVVMGDADKAKRALRAGWHIASLNWWGMAGVFVWLHIKGAGGHEAFLVMMAVIFGISGLASLILSRGRHLAWLCFLPTAAISGYSVLVS